MIANEHVEQWHKNAPWRTLAMIEQDLIISRVLVELFNHPQIPKSLVFRGGTALNKLYIKPPARYSEDIDLVQIRPEPIGKTMNAMRSVLDPWLGEPRYKLTRRSVKLFYKFESIEKAPVKLKIEINTTEHFQVQKLKSMDFSMDSEWFSGKAKILTYELEELMATKLKALYQRSKGRDLFDMWLVLNKGLINLDTTFAIFDQYCEREGQKVTRAMFEKSMASKRENKDFNIDMHELLAVGGDWNFNEAFDIVHDKIINNLRGDPWKGAINN